VELGRVELAQASRGFNIKWVVASWVGECCCWEQGGDVDRLRNFLVVEIEKAVAVGREI
jgi:hypothetical protein